MLEVRDLDVFYGSAQALHHVSVSLARNEVVFVVGRNGAGKTTLLKTIAGLIVPRRGTIQVEGRNIAGNPPEVLARLGIRYVFQDKRVFSHLTVRENIEIAAYALGISWRTAVDAVLRLYPKLERFLNVGAGALSGGQRQLLLIGRASIGEPKLLLLDEPTEGLAAGVVEDVVRAVQETRGRMGVIMVEQNLSVVGRLADRVYVMREGKIAGEVATEDVHDARRLEAYISRGEADPRTGHPIAHGGSFGLEACS